MFRHATIAIASIFPIFAGCGGLHEEADVTDARELPADVRLIRIRVPLGSLTVHGGPDGELRLVGRRRKTAGSEADLERLKAIDFTPTFAPVGEPGVYSYRFPELPDGVDRGNAAMILRAELHLPRSVAIDVETDRGDLGVIGRDAPCRLRTGSGGLQVDDLTGDVDGFTGLGGVILHGVRGSVAVESGGGAILAYIDGIGPGGVRLKTRDPSIICHLPAGAAFDLDARVIRSNDGKIGIRDSFGVPVVESGAGHVARGPVRGGGPVVGLEASTGWISVPVTAER